MIEVTRWERVKAAEMNETYLKQLKDTDNLTITELTPEQREAWKAAFKPLYAGFAGDIGLDLINELLKHN